MFKWKLLIATLPFVVIIVAIALIRDYVLRLHGILEFSEVAPLLSAVALIVGIMMAGVLTDYKESEKIPGEIATTLETIGDTIQVVAALNKETDISALGTEYGRLVATVEDWFMGRTGVNQCYAVLDDFRQALPLMQQAVGVNYVIRSLGEIHNLRRLITRVDVIAKTSFIPAGYALLDLLVGTTITLLLMINYKTVLAEYFLISLLSLIYIYLLRLIRDVDNPFEYVSKNNKSSTTEVNPFPVQNFRQRFESNKQIK